MSVAALTRHLTKIAEVLKGWQIWISWFGFRVRINRSKDEVHRAATIIADRSSGLSLIQLSVMPKKSGSLRPSRHGLKRMAISCFPLAIE